MKRFRLQFITVILFTTFFISCEPEETFFDETLLYGKWKSGTEYYRYFSDGKGYTWDTADDVSESEAQNFTWTLNASDLTHKHIIQMGGIVPKYYTIIELTETTLKYKDEYKTYSFTKVSN